MGYRMAVNFKTIKKSIFLSLVKLFVLFFLFFLNYIGNFFIVLLLVPIINFTLNYCFFKKYEIRIILYSWTSSFLLFLILAIYMYYKNSFLGLALVGILHLYGFTISDLICIIVRAIEKRRTE